MILSILPELLHHFAASGIFDDPPKAAEKASDFSGNVVAICAVATLIGGMGVYTLGKAFGAGQFEANSKARFMENKGGIESLRAGQDDIWKEINKAKEIAAANAGDLKVLMERSKNSEKSLDRLESNIELIRRATVSHVAADNRQQER
jgi:hypothetical protein